MTEHVNVPLPEEPTTSTRDDVGESLKDVPQHQTPEGTDTSWEELRQQFSAAGRVALSGVVEVAKGTLETGLVATKIGVKATKNAKDWTSSKAGEFKAHREEKKTVSANFKKELGKFALATLEKGNTKIDKPAASTFRQNLELSNTIRKLNKVERKKAKAQSTKRPTHGTAPYGKARKETFLTRRSELKDAFAAYKAGEIKKDELLERQKNARELIVWQGSVRPVKAMRKAKRIERSLKNGLSLDDTQNSTDVRQAKNPEAAAPVADAVVKPLNIPKKEVGVAPAQAQPKVSSLERLRKMREEGLLPEAPATPKPGPQPVETEPAAPEAPTTAEKEELNSTEKLAEIAYIAAKDEVFRLIDQENDERAKTGKSPLTQKEKEDIWKRERSIRQGLLQSLTPENRKLVNEQIRKLIEEDREARKDGKEQLRDRRRREAREAESKKREDAKEAKRKADADKKEREKQAAAAVARNAAQTAIDS